MAWGSYNLFLKFIHKHFQQTLYYARFASFLCAKINLQSHCEPSTGTAILISSPVGDL